MSFENKILTSIHGRRFGLQRLSTGESGGTRGPFEFIVGPEAVRQNVSTSDTTAINLHAFGVSRLTSGTSSVYTIDPPIPGVTKTIIGSTEGPAFVKTQNSETIVTTAGSSFTTVKISSLGGVFQLVGITTAQWAGIGITTGTSSQASGFGLSTST